MRVVQAFSRQGRNYDLFRDYTNRYHLQTAIHAAKVAASFLPVVDVLGALATAAVIWIGGTAVLGESITAGVLVNLGNPKAIVFIAALVPPFIDSGLPRLPQFLVIGATMCCVDVLVMSGYALLAGRFRGVARGNRAVRLQNRLFGGVFVAAGLALTATSRH